MDEETKPVDDTKAPVEEKSTCCGGGEGACACQTAEAKEEKDGCCQS